MKKRRKNLQMTMTPGSVAEQRRDNKAGQFRGNNNKEIKARRLQTCCFLEKKKSARKSQRDREKKKPIQGTKDVIRVALHKSALK